MKKLFLISIVIMLTSALPAWATNRGLLISGAAMVLSSSTKQGGQGPSGSSILTQFDVVHSWHWVGIGVFYQYDKQGTNQEDTMLGPKIEFGFGAFYLEAGYGVRTQRDFTDRSIAKQSGSGMVYGLGVRFGLKGGGSARKKGATKGVFFQAAYKSRTQTLQDQDGVTLSEPIVQSDSYPLFGLGYDF